MAIKIIPVETDLQDLMKEISILKSCRSDYIVRYYGSYYKDNDLWIVMEYCGGGSLSDLMMKGKHPLREDEIRYVISEVLMGVAYLHENKKIHRDIKSGNILLTDNAVAKLADFGVSVQLDNTMSKRKTVIGTPFWMAPEVLQETSYNWKADIWSLGITAIELADGYPPYSNIHPLRAIIMIPNRPPPHLADESKWSKEFVDFVAQCLTKDPNQRPSAQQLLEHPFVAATVEKLRHSRGSSNTMKNMLARLRELKRQAKREHAAAKPQPKPEPVEYHGANETLVQEGQAGERHDETVQVKESKPPVPFPHVLPPAVMPAQKPSPVNTKTMLPPPPAIPSRGPPAKQQIVKAGQPNIESIAATYLPEIPTQRPANSSNLTEWIKQQRLMKEVAAQFKNDFQLLYSAYNSKMESIKERMEALSRSPGEERRRIV